MQQGLNARRDVYEFGLLPLHAVCPALDCVATLHNLHARLMARSTTTPAGQNVVASPDVASILGLTPSQQEILLEVLTTLSLNPTGALGGIQAVAGGSGPSPMDCSPAGATSRGTSQPVLLHELLLFLLLQLYSKEAVRPDNQEIWPEVLRLDSNGSGGPFEFARPTTPELLSPTRQMSRSPSGSKNVLRQQLQQHVRQHAAVVRGFGDFVRRNLRTVLDLCLDESLPAPALQPGASPPAIRISAHEVDRAEFLVQRVHGSSDGSLSSYLPQLANGSTAPIDSVVASIRQHWTECAELLPAPAESPRVALASGSSLSSASSSGSGTFGAGGGATFTLSRINSGGRSAGGTCVSAIVEEGVISGVVKGTVVRGEAGEHAAGTPAGELRVADCHDAVLYLLGPLQYVYIVGCSDCTIVLGAVGTVVRLERCDKLQVMAATSRLIISSCHECSLFLGINHSPIIIGDNRFLRLAPFNTRYERQLAHLRDAGVRLDVPNRWDTPLVLAGKDRKGMSSSPDSPRAFSSSTASAPKPPFSLLPAEEFLPFVVPFQGAGGPLAGGPAPPQATRWSQLASISSGLHRTSSGGGTSISHTPPQQPQQQAGQAQAQSGAGPSGSGSAVPAVPAPLYLFPLPSDYERALHRKLSMTGELRQRFKQAGLGRDKERELNDAIQGHFREWLSSSSMLRQIYDLSNLEKEEQQQAFTAAVLQQQ